MGKAHSRGFTAPSPRRPLHAFAGGGRGDSQKEGVSTISSLCSPRERTSEARNRRWQPSVRIDVSFPERAQRLTVFGLTRKRTATSAGVKSGSGAWRSVAIGLPSCAVATSLSVVDQYPWIARKDQFADPPRRLVRNGPAKWRRRAMVPEPGIGQTPPKRDRMHSMRAGYSV